jgi:GT2 family glycosyltransferase
MIEGFSMLLGTDVSIIIPFYNRWVHTNNMLNQLYRLGMTSYQVILSDDGSTDRDEVINGTTFWLASKKFSSLLTISEEENHGFGEALRVGVECPLGTGSYIVLLSNDVILHQDFIPWVVGQLEGNPKSIVAGNVFTHDTGWNSFPTKRGQKIFPYCEGWLMGMTRDAWNDIGGFDPIYLPFDYEDVDFGVTASLKGYTFRQLPAGMAEHKLGGTILYYHGVEGRLSQTHINREKFLKKWAHLIDE